MDIGDNQNIPIFKTKKIMKLFNKLIISLITLLSFTVGAQNKKWKCIDKEGNELFTVEAKRVYPFQNDRARIYKKAIVKNKWISSYGFINIKGETVIPCNFDKAKDFYGPITWVRAHGEEYYDLIDVHGKVIPTGFKYDRVGSFYEWQKDITAVYKDKKMGFVNTEGEEVIPCKYYGSNSFNEGLACIAKHGIDLYGYINKKGEEVIPLDIKQTGVAPFKNGKARAYKNGRTVLIDKTGKVVFDTEKGNIQSVSDDLVLVFTEKNRKGWGWLNFDNEFVIQPEYDHAINFNESGYAVVEKNGLKGLINKQGEVLLDFKYKTIYAEVETDGFIAAVYPSDEPIALINQKIDYFDDKLNKVVLPEGVKYVYPAGGSAMMKFVDHAKKVGYMDRDFNIVIEAQYKRGKQFSQGMAFVLEE